MATLNPFDLLGDDDAEDPLQLIAAQQLKAPTAAKKAAQQQSKPVAAAAKLPSKPLPPAQSVREAKAEAAHRGGRRGGRGYDRGHGGRGFDRDPANTENSFGNKEISSGQGGAPEDADGGRFSERRGGYVGPRGPYRGGRRGGFSNGELGDGERSRRVFERGSGTGRGNEIKHEGAGQGNWGTETDGVQAAEEVVHEVEKNPTGEKPTLGEEDTADGNKEAPANESEEKEPENKEMTLEEYEKVLEEKRKTLQSAKTEERKVDAKAFASMQQLANKKANEDVFIKLGADKDKKKDFSEKEERAKKSLSINEFLKPVEGERHYSPGGRGRGRGRGFRGYGAGNSFSNVEAPSIEDPGQFPTLSTK